MAGQLLGEVDPLPRAEGESSSSELRIVYLDFASSPTGTLSGTNQLPTGFVDGVITTDELAGGTFAGDPFAGGEIVAGDGLRTYAVRGSFLNQLDFESGSVESLELPAPILSAHLLADGRILASLDTAGDAAKAVPAVVLVSFASGEWEPVADGELAGTINAAALARGDRGLLVPTVSEAQPLVTLRSLQVDPDSGDVLIRSLPFEVAAESRVVASTSGPLALISAPSEAGLRVSLWSTRVDAPVAGSEQRILGISDILLFDDATSLAVARQIDGGIQILDGANRFAALHTLPEWTGPVALDARGEWLFGIRADRTLQIFDIREGRVRYTLPLEIAAAEIVGGLALADGGNRLALSTSAGVTQLRIDRLKLGRSPVGTDAQTVDQLFGDYEGDDYGSGGGADHLNSFASLQQGNIDPGDVSIPENELGALIAHLQVTGVDASKDVRLEVEDDRFILEGNELRLAPEVAFDYELEPVVRVEIVLASVEPNEILARQTLVITVTDVDDAITDITLDRQEIPERAPGYIVSPVRVLDEDSDDHTLSVDDGRFEIQNGNLKLREGVFVRRSDQAEILVTITASDAASAAGSFSKEFVLTVTANEAPLHNSSGPTDVNGDGHTDPLDALLVINILNQGGPALAGDPFSTGGEDVHFYDVNGDGLITPLDALIIINEINRRNGGQAEGGRSGSEGESSGEGESVPLEWTEKSREFAEAALPESPSFFGSFQTSNSIAVGGPASRGTSVAVSDRDLASETTNDPSRDRVDPRDDYFSGLGFGV